MTTNMFINLDTRIEELEKTIESLKTEDVDHPEESHQLWIEMLGLERELEALKGLAALKANVEERLEWLNYRG